MKKLLLSVFVIFSGIVSGVYGQCNIDTTQTTPGISPDTLTWACENVPYENTITFVFANDTTVTTPLGPLTVDFLSYKILSVSNLPAGITYVCDNSNCTWNITSGQVNRGCIKLSGIPTAVYNDSITVTVEATLNTTLLPPTAVPVNAPFRVQSAADCNTTRTAALLSTSSIQLFPNPGSDMFTLLNTSEDMMYLEVLDMTGKKVYEEKFPTGTDRHNVNTAAWKSGMYLVKVQTPAGIKTFRWSHN